MIEIMKAFQAGKLSLEDAAKEAKMTKANFLEALGKWPVFWIDQDGLTAYKIVDNKHTIAVDCTEEDDPEVTKGLIDALADILHERSWLIMDWRKLSEKQKVSKNQKRS
jgi:hypothetical protein